MTRRTVRWRALAWEGWEHLELDTDGPGITARAVAIGAIHGTAYGICYEAHLDRDWSFRSLVIRCTSGACLALRRAEDGAWTDGGGRALPSLEGCNDIDLSGSPFTNSLPVRRAAFEDGVPVQFDMAWIPLDTLQPFPDRQVYTRLGDGRFRYQSGDGGFECEIAFDRDGLVTNYPGLFEAIPIRNENLH